MIAGLAKLIAKVAMLPKDAPERAMKIAISAILHVKAVIPNRLAKAAISGVILAKAKEQSRPRSTRRSGIARMLLLRRELEQHLKLLVLTMQL